MTGGGGEEEDVEEGLYLFVVVFPFICLIGGLVLDLARERFSSADFKLPSTVFQLIVSCLISSLMHNFLAEEDWLMVGFRRYTWVGRDPHHILSALLPILIFQSSFHLDAHDFSHHILFILTLAVLGFFLSMALVAGLMATMMDIVGNVDGWTTTACLTYGALISATDPVAVVALLEELGAPSSLSVLIDGEALLNDGAAIIAFKLLFMSLSGEGELSWGVEIGSLVLGVLTSVLLGYISARCVVWILIHASQGDVTREQGVVFFSVFAVFLICEDIPLIHQEGSGVLGLVVFGVTLSSRRENLKPRTVEEMLHLWEFLAYWANSIVFILTGLWIGRFLKQDHHHSGALWWLGGLGAYVFSVLARGVVVGVLCGVGRVWKLKKGHTYYSWPYIFLMFWAGLRGAVALLLAIQLKGGNINQNVQDYTLIFVGMSVMCSLVIQGASFEPLAKYLGLNERRTYQEKRLEQRLEELRNDKAGKRLLHLQMEKKFYYLSECDWNKVWNILYHALGYKKKGDGHPIKTAEATMPTPWKDTDNDLNLTSMTSAVSVTKGKLVDNPEDEALDSYLRLLKIRLWRMWEERLLSSRTVRRLTMSIDSGLDDGELPDVTALAQETQYSGWWWIKLARWSQVMPEIKRMYESSHDWWRVVQFVMESVIMGITLWTSSNTEHTQGVHLFVFFFSLYNVVEQTALLPQKTRDLNLSPSYCLLFLFFVDVIYIFVDASIVILTGISLSGHCFTATDDGGGGTFRDVVPLCGFLQLFLPVTTGIRFVLKLPPILRLLFQLSAEALQVYISTAVTMSRVAVLTAIMRITEDIDYNLLSRAIPGQNKLMKACHYNQKLKKDAEDTLLTTLQEPEQIGITRLIQTRQASRLLLRHVAKDIEKMQHEGMLTLDEYKELEERVSKGLLQIQKWTNAADMPEPSLELQLRRVGWLQHGKQKERLELFKFLIEPDRLHISRKWATEICTHNELEGMIFLISGIMEIVRKDRNQKNFQQNVYPGTFIGSELGEEETYESVTAATDCTVGLLSSKDSRLMQHRFPCTRTWISLELSIAMVREVVCQYRPFGEFTRTQTEEHLRNKLVKIKHPLYEPNPDAKSHFVLTGLVWREMEDPQTVRIGERPMHLECSFTVAPISDLEPALLITTTELRDDLRVRKTKSREVY